VSFALNALNLDDLMPEALELLHFSRHRSSVQLEIPLAQADALTLDVLVLAVDAQNRRQLFKITDIEASTNTEARLQLKPVYGVPVLQASSFFRVSAETLAPFLLNSANAPILDAQFPALRILMRDVYGQFHLEADQEERGLELLLSLLLNVRQEGMHPLLFDAYGILKRSELPGIHLVELGRTHALPVESWGVERLIEEWTKTLPLTQAEEAWRQWNAIAGQRIFRVRSLRELEEVFLSTQSGLLFRLLNQFKSSNVFCEGGHQQSVHFMQELKQAESEGKLLVFDLSSVSLDFHPWVWKMLNQALRHSLVPLSHIWVGHISRKNKLPAPVAHEVNQLLEQGVNVLALHPMAFHSTLVEAENAHAQHCLKVKNSDSTALFVSELSLGIPLLFGDFPALPLASPVAHVPHVLAPALPYLPLHEAVPSSATWTDMDAVDPQSSSPFQAIEPPSLETPFYEEATDFLDAATDELFMSFSPDAEVSSSEASSPETRFEDDSPEEANHTTLTQDAVHRYSSILGEMPEEWRNLIETQLLNPHQQDQKTSTTTSVDTSEEVDSTHHIHPCLPDSMLEDVTPYLDESADSGFDEPEKSTLHVEYIIDGKEELKRKPQSTADALEQALHQTEPTFGQEFDPYYVPAPDESFHEDVPEPIASSLVGPILEKPILESLADFSFEAPDEPGFEPTPSPLLPASSPELPDFSLDLNDAMNTPSHSLVLEEALTFESEGFYDDLLNEPIIEAHAPQNPGDALNDAFLPNTPAQFNPQAQLEEMTTVFDAVQAGDVSLPVHQAVEVESLSLEDLDNFNFDLNVIDKAVHAEFTDMTSEHPVSHEDFIGHEEQLAQAPAPVEAPVIDPEDPLAGFSFEMPQPAFAVQEEVADVPAEEESSHGMPEFLVPPFDEASFAEDDLIQSFQQDLAEMDSGYVPLKGSQYNQTAPMQTLTEASPMSAITPPHSLDGVAIAHTPLYEYQDDIPMEPMNLPSDFPVHYTVGMQVQHEIYGSGVVHSVVDIESRTVLSIVFEKAGKRLIDPTLTSVLPA